MKTNWQSKKLGEVLEIQNGFAFDSKRFSKDKGKPLIRIRDLKNGFNTETNYIGEFDKKYEVKKGDFLIGMDGEFGCYEWKGNNALLNQRVCKMQNFTGLDSRFLFYGINKYLEEIEESTGFTTVKHISSSQIINIYFSFPDLKEQKRIVKVLDKVFENINKAKENTEKNIQNSKELFESYLENIFTKSKIDWEAKKLNEICDLKSGTTISKTFEKQTGEILYVKVGDMNMVGNEVRINSSSRFVDKQDINTNQIVPGGSVIFPKRGGAIFTNKRRKIVKPTIVDLNIMALVPSIQINPDLLYYWFLRIDLRDLNNGSSVPQINKYSFDNVFISYPTSLLEQKTIVQRLDELSKQTKKLEENYRRKLLLLNELKKSVLQKAFAGEL